MKPRITIPAKDRAPKDAVELIRPYLEGQLSADEANLVAQWAAQDAGFAAQIEKRRWLLGELGKAYQEHEISGSFEESAQAKLRETASKPQLAVKAEVEDSLQEEPVGFFAGSVSHFGSAPWWAVSVSLHVLAILLASLVTMTIGQVLGPDEVIIVTNIEKQTTAQLEEDRKETKQTLRDVLESKDTPATDVNSEVQSNIVVPPDILAKAELGDHFETINPDRPDTQSAFGNPDARMFHSVEGNDEPEGGGGSNGDSLMDALIGVGSSASPGTGSGWGGGNGTGTGIGTGAGHGSFGNRSGGGRKLMVMKHGGSKGTESAVDKALEWLVRHQEKDGFWDTAKYLDNKAVRYGTRSAESSPRFNTGITGLALLAFQGAGHSLKVGKYKEVLRRGIQWLIAQQGPDGDFTFKVKPCKGLVTYYCHCIATLACAEALAMNGGKDWGGKDGSWGEAQGKGIGLREAVQRGVDLILKWQEQNSTGGWTYYAPNVCDVTVSGWAVMALKSSKIAGIKIPADSFTKAAASIKNSTVVDKAKGAYGEAHIGYLKKNDHRFNSKGYAVTAAGMMIHVFLGTDREEANIDACVQYITQPDALPQWIFKPQDVNTDHQNLYYWYYGTLGCFQVGGDAWKLWNEKMKAALLPNQKVGGVKDGSPQDVDGSWDPDDVWGAWSGRVYSTALAALSLEVYYRYLPLYR